MRVGDLVRFADHSKGGRVDVSIITDIKIVAGIPWLAQILRSDPSKNDLWWPVHRLEGIDASR